ncbi:type 1 glutamine amidotransferase family protein [Tessaracoccus coleopterorum]|uniref:hypothetical protein n=1 Tax=Tessaracoccus coleopterorum TaxID=2714950 RepID=UPI0018D413D8|nr:hypothetical protein [Tessaracoccus coleopterorum]
MKPFLLLSTRPEDAASQGEFEAIVRFGGLREDEVVQYRVEAEPLPVVDLADYAGVFLGGGPSTRATIRSHLSSSGSRPTSSG